MISLAIGPVFSVNALEISGGVTVPSGGIINSIYVSGTPIGGVTLKLKTEDNLEYTAFFGGGFGLVSIEKIEKMGGEGVFGQGAYGIFGGSLPLALNLGGGLNLFQIGNFGVRIQYVTLISGGGTVLGSNSGGPYFLGWSSLLASYRF
ncbi:MAG: hypothetical protein HQM14_18850 [SAR324 cluster bacterium]|nr:hypothetical protein [SAR324 cluster bacterium]